MADQPQQRQLSVQADPKKLVGHYANAFSVTSQERDVVIDFLTHVNNGDQPAQLSSRIFLNHFTAQALITTLQQTMERWEKMRYENK